MPVVMERKALFARKDLVDQLLQLAKMDGISLYNLVNDIFETYIRLRELGVKPYEALDEVIFYKTVFTCGLVIFPCEVVRELLRDKCGNLGSLIELMRRSGARLSKYYMTMYNTGPKEALSRIIRVIEKTMSCIGEIDTEPILPGKLIVTYVNNNLPVACNKAFTEYIRGALEELGFRVLNIEETGPIVRIELEKQV